MVEVLDFILCKRYVKGFMNNLSNEMFSGYFNCIKDFYVLMFFSDVISYIGLYYIGIYLFGFDDFLKEIKCRWRFCFENGRYRRLEMCVEFKDFLIIFFLIFRVIVLEYDFSIDVNYILLIFMGVCLYWFEVKEKWILYGCRVSEIYYF